MSYIPRYDKGDWIADCDVCGRKYKASVLRQRWDGLMCCPDDWEIRQPQDFVRGIPDTQIAPWLRPEPNDSFIPVTTVQWLIPWLSTTVSLSLLVTRHFTDKIITFLTTSISSITTNKVPVPSPSTESVNGDAINNQSLG